MRLPSRPCGNKSSQTPLRIAQNKPKIKDFAICNDFLPCNSGKQALDCCWHNISSRDGLKKTWNTPSLKDDRHLVCSRATSGFTLPHPSQLYLVCFQFSFFSTTKIKKRFSFQISSPLILFPAVSLHMKLLCQV